jgi:hypothetical protein
MSNPLKRTLSQAQGADNIEDKTNACDKKAKMSSEAQSPPKFDFEVTANKTAWVWGHDRFRIITSRSAKENNIADDKRALCMRCLDKGVVHTQVHAKGNASLKSHLESKLHKLKEDDFKPKRAFLACLL